jgi:hypothetical protein
MSSHEVLHSRASYFKTGEEIGNHLMNRYRGETVQLYEDKKEHRFNVRYGTVFLIATCLLDWYVCSM